MKKFINYVVLFLSLPAVAHWAPNKESDTVIERVDCSVDIKNDGNFIEEEEITYTAKNENGRNTLALTKIPFFPESSTIEIIKAASITDGVETPVDLKTIHEQTSPGPEGGVSGQKEYVIPFTNLKIGSSIKYKYKTTSKKPLHPGVFAMQFIYGAREPEMAGKCVLKSDKLLHFAVKDRERLLKVEQGKDKEVFTLTITLVKPATMKLQDEKLPIFSHDSFSQVQVTTIDSWNQFASQLAERYEKILQQELPPVFKAIAAKAKQKKDIYEQIDVVTSELATIMTYSGNWTSVDKMYFPRGHAEVAASKTGDCKDFATTTTAILRQIGISANVALVGRKSPYSPGQVMQTTPMQQDIAMPSLFNHLIVRVEPIGKPAFWVDPTNIVSNSRFSNQDIAGSNSLNVSKTTIKLEVIPNSRIEDSVVNIEKTIKIRPDEKADSQGTITGSGIYTGQIVETAFRDGATKADEVALGYFGSTTKDTTSKVETKNYKSRIIDKFEAKVSVSGEKVYVSKEGKDYIYIPLPSFLEVYYLGSSSGRVTDFYSLGKGKYQSSVKVQGFDFQENESNGCLAVSPWFEVERKIIKNESGFEVRDTVLSKKEMISSRELNEDEYGYSLSDVNDCVRAQAIQVTKLEPTKGLSQRLSGYTMEAINKLLESRGPGTTKRALTARGMALQLLEKNPNDVEAKLALIKTYRWIGYRSGDNYGPEYLFNADRMIDEILAKSPDHTAALIQKSYYKGRMNDLPAAKKYFSKAYYSSPQKGYDLYSLGGYITDKSQQPQVAMNSYLKALAAASSDFQRSVAYSRLGTLARETNDFAKADEYLTMALKYAPDDAWLMNDVLILAISRNDFDKAIDLGEKMIKVSDFGVGRMNLASAYCGKSQQLISEKTSDETRFEKAAESAMKGLKWDEKSASCMIALAKSYQAAASSKNDSELANKSSDMWIKALAYAKNDEDRQTAMNGVNGLNAVRAQISKSRMPSSVKPSK